MFLSLFAAPDEFSADALSDELKNLLRFGAVTHKLRIKIILPACALTRVKRKRGWQLCHLSFCISDERCCRWSQYRRHKWKPIWLWWCFNSSSASFLLVHLIYFFLLLLLLLLFKSRCTLRESSCVWWKIYFLSPRKKSAGFRGPELEKNSTLSFGWRRYEEEKSDKGREKGLCEMT